MTTRYSPEIARGSDEVDDWIRTGGVLEPRTGSLVGALASCAAHQLVTSRFILSCAGLDASIGATEVVLEEPR